MRLLIKNFRCHKYLDLNIQSPLVHISGDSGVGKTTIYEAIKWCVYGAKIVVSPHDQKPAPKTEVTLMNNRFLVTRSNNPRTVLYQDINGILTGEEAQNKINLLFGSHPLWIVEQKKDHLLMNSSLESQQHDAIMSILFPNSNHQEYVTNIKNNYKRTLNELEVAKIQCQQLGIFIRDEVHMNNLTQRHFDAIDRLQDLEDIVSLKNAEIEATIANNASINQFLSRKSILESKMKTYLGDKTKEDYELELSMLEEKLDTVDIDKLTKNKNELEKSIQSHSKMEVQLSKISDINNRIRDLSNSINLLEQSIDSHTRAQQLVQRSHPSLNHSQFLELYDSNNRRSGMRSIHLNRASQLGIPYNEEARNKELSNLRSMIVADITSLRNEHQSLVRQLEAKVRVAQELPSRERLLRESNELLLVIDKENANLSELISSRESDIIKIVNEKEKLLSQYQLSLLTESCRRLTCPHCENECGLLDSKLVKLEDVPESTSSSQSIMNSLNLVNNRIDTISREIKQFNARLNNNNIRISSTKSTIANLDNQINQLREAEKLTVSSSIVTELTTKIKNHDNASSRIHDVEMLDIVEVEDLTNDKEWWRLDELINGDVTNRDNKTTIMNELQSQLQSQQDELSQYGEVKNANIHQLKSELSSVINSIRDSIANSDRWKKEIEAIRTTLTTIEVLQNEWDEVQQSPLNHKSLIDVNSMQEYVTKLSRDIQEVRRAKNLQPRRYEYQLLNNRIQELTKMMEHGSIVLSSINTFKYIAIENAMNRLSSCCNKILEFIFDEPILMKITTIKILKNGVKKNRINLEINRNGIPVEYGPLSGGQKERISLAIALAVIICHPTTVQIVLLDEVLNSLNECQRTRCLKLFSRAADHNPIYELMEPLLNSKVFIFTDHIVGEHYFDQVVNIS